MKKGTSSSDVSPEGSASKNIEGILDFNALQYECFPDLSVVIDRTYKESFFQQGSYSGGSTAYCILNSGSDFIHPRNSVLMFDITAPLGGTGITAPIWKRGDSAYNLIRAIRITDRAGNEIERVEDVDILAAIRLKCERSDSYLSSVGSMFGYNLDKDATNTLGAGAGTTARLQSGTRLALPLRYISGLWDFDQLLPAQLCSGLRIQITFNDAVRAFSYNVNEGPNTLSFDYTISNPRIILDSYKLTDSVTRQLNVRSANDGLEIQFRTWFTSTYHTTGETELNLESRRAVSRAFCAIAHTKVIAPNDIIASGVQPAYAYRSTGPTSAPWNYLEYQWRAGNLYFPQQVLKGPTPLHTVTSSMHEVFSKCGKLDTPIDNPTLDYDDYAVGLDITVERPEGIVNFVPLDLERSTVQDVSGLPLNNSRVLAFNAKFADSTWPGNPTPLRREIRIFLQYLKIARVFMDNTELEE